MNGKKLVTIKKKEKMAKQPQNTQRQIATQSSLKLVLEYSINFDFSCFIASCTSIKIVSL